MANVQYYGTGRRKHSVARVRLVAGEGNIKVNGRDLEEYFNYETLIRDVKQPLVLTGNENKYDAIVKVEGGGFTGQAGAIRHGISRALLKADEELRGTLKAEGFLTRDSRMKERNMVLRLPEELHSSLRDREYQILRQLSNPDTAMYSGFFNGCRFLQSLNTFA